MANLKHMLLETETEGKGVDYLSIRGSPLVRKKSDYIQVSWRTSSTLKIEIGKNVSDIIDIEPSGAIPGVVNPCQFSGKMRNDPKVIIVVIGCKGYEETSLYVSLPDMFHPLVLKDGVTYK